MLKKISVFLIFIIPFGYAQRGIKVISSDARSLVAEYIPQADTTTEIIDFQKYYKINLLGGQYPSEPGIPAIPYSVLNIAVPSEFGNTIEIISANYKIINGKVKPVPYSKKDGELSVSYYKIGSEYYSKLEKELVSFGEFGYLRDLPVQGLIINPIDFNPDLNEIRLFSRIVFRVNFSNEQKINSSAKEDAFISDMILNYSVGKSWVRVPTLKKATSSSVLENGRWFRFEAPEEGMYRITRNQLNSFGIDAASVDPRTIKIYNNGGKPLPENSSVSVPNDLVENAIIVKGEEDGKFDDSDEIVFYGRGVNFWEYDNPSLRILRRSNPYSKENYFWITSGGNPGKRMEQKSSSSENSGFIQNSTKSFKYLEEDKINIVRSGRVFLGDEYNETVRTRSYMNKLDARVEGSPVNYEFRFVNSDSKAINLKIEEQQTVIYNRNLASTANVPEGTYSAGNPTLDKAVFNSVLPENRSVLKFTFNASGFLSKGYIDFFDIRYEKYLSAIEDEIIYFATDTNAVIEYHLNNFSGSNDIVTYDITDYANVKSIINPLLVSGGDYQFRASEILHRGGKYITLREGKYRTPVNPVEVPNSNVHGITESKYIIITHKNFALQAVKLKEFRENSSKYPLSTVVVDINEIYNEFSSGMKDITAIRNFIKYAYDNWTVKPEYVVLFGDGDYDYRNIEGFGKNFVPTYQVHDESNFWKNLHHIESYPMDDYFVRVSGDDPKIDLAIGRINIQSTIDADKVVNKIIKYEAESGKGTWQNLITLLADDAYTSRDFEGPMHVSPSEDIAIKYIPQSFDINKIYMSAYPVELTSSGRRKPSVTKAIVDAINQGTVIFNFMGHGSPAVWTHEVVFENSTTIPMMNNDKLFFLVAATCDFAYFDNPSSQSGTELLILKENSGAIGGFTASRPVYVNENIDLSYDFFEELLKSPREPNQLPISIGKVYMNIRVNYNQTSTNDLKYHLFGDPALKLAIPQYPAEISSVNGQSLQQPVQIQALGKVHIDGVIKKDSLNLWEDYNGEGILSVYDSYRTVKLADVDFNARVQGGLIFRGFVSINNGRFAADFTVPKDISYENRNGKIVLYFYNQGTDGITYTQNILINGTDTTAVNDGKGPVVDVFFDYPEYRNAYLVNPNSELIVKLQDETGLNTTGTGVGHRLEGILNDNESEPINFTNYFTGDKDAAGKSGEVRYRFTNIQEGEHKILVKAWDVFNNFSSKTEFFSVLNSGDKDLRDLYNYPNPFKDNTVFTFQQNFNTVIDVKIKIYTVAGRLIRQLERYGISETEGFVKVEWDGRDQDGDRIANGTYLYKVIVNSTDGQYSKSALGKLAIIN